MFHICDYFETNRYICLPKMRAIERKLGGAVVFALLGRGKKCVSLDEKRKWNLVRWVW